MYDLVIDALKAVHGEAIIFKGDGSLTVPFTGVFDETYDEVDPNTGQTITTQTPSLVIALADIPERPRHGHTFVIRAQNYVVHKYEPDGKGAARIFLSESD